MTVPSLAELREQYQRAVTDAEAADTFWQWLEDYAGNEGIVHAYRGSALALIGSHAWNPVKKLGCVQQANRAFRRAVRLDPQNIEIRFLRFAIQHHLPGFLGESTNLEEDKAVTLAHFHRYRDFDLSDQHAYQFWDFYAQSGRFSEAEIAEMKQHVPKQQFPS